MNQSADSVCKLCLDPSSYVTEAWPGKAVIGQADGGGANHAPCCAPGDSAAAAFKDLKKLSRVFKDQVAYPLITASRHGKGYWPLLWLHPPRQTRG